MKSFKFIISLFLGIFTSSFGQDCTCESNFQWVKKTFEENDAGFQYIIDQKGKEAYEAHNQKFLQKFKNIKTDLECTSNLYEWLRFFRSGHIGISNLVYFNPKENNFKVSEEKVNISLKEFQKYLAKKQDADLEGVWEISPYKIGIQKIGSQYKGFIIESENANWQPLDLKLVINEDQESAVYYRGDKSAQDIEGIRLIGKNYLELGQFKLKRIFPKFEDDEADKKAQLYLKSITSGTPFLEQLNENTLLLRVPSFIGEHKKAIDSVLVANKTKLESTENLIIDLRNNGGGSDHSFAEILLYLYTNPIRTIGAEFYSTPLNNRRFLDFYENAEKYNFSEKQKNLFKNYYDKLSANLGKFISLHDKTISETKYEKVLPYPKQVAIIINNNNASTTEQFLLAAKQSKKVKLFGTTTAGALDVSNMIYVNNPCNEFQLGYCISKSLRIPEMAIDEKGIQPDYYIDKTIPPYEWVSFVNDILNLK
ncbi:MAG: S41 family peptidase [Flavobacteriaceae bacterium]|nr:S41 family peptidase [Flavobacteriaceae bacterium]